MLLSQGDYISVDEFKLDAPEVDVSLYTDTTLSGFITKASRKIDKWLGYSLKIEHIANEHAESHVDADGNLVIFPKKRPIVTVSGIDIVKGTDTVSLTLTDADNNQRYDVVDEREIVYPTEELSVSSVSIIGSFWDIARTRFFTELDYQAGYQDIPEDIKDATVLFLRDIISRKQNVAGAKSIKQGTISISYEQGSEESDFIKDAKEILRPYKRLSGW